MKQSYAVITGASSGIGREFAKQLALKGYPLILVARREQRLVQLCKELEEYYHVKAGYICADVSKEEECYRVLKELEKVPVELFINNAGFGDCGTYETTALEKELEMTNVNIKAVQIFSKGILNRFVKENRGYLLNVASSAGLLPAGPYMAAYYASKSYVVSFTRAIAFELKQKHSRVYVGALCPGPVHTEFNSVANVRFALKGMKVTECVREACRQMQKKKIIIVPGRALQAATLFSKLIPVSLQLPMIARQQKKKV